MGGGVLVFVLVGRLVFFSFCSCLFLFLLLLLLLFVCLFSVVCSLFCIGGMCMFIIIPFVMGQMALYNKTF